MTQNSREAVIDLLFVSLYLDNHLSLAEDEILNSALDSLGWESPNPREKYIYKAFSEARDVAACEITTADFIDAKAAIIKADGQEAAALTWFSRVLGSDGLVYSEKRFLDQLEARLFPNG